jgi:polyisoprenoid-binding protein YceI
VTVTAAHIGTAVAATYILDKSASRFTVRAFAGGMLSAMGHSPTFAIRNFTGEAEFDPAAPGQAKLKMEIRADSLEVTDEISGEDRREIESAMNQKVLESSKYELILFESTSVSAEQVGEGRFKVSLNGNVSLHGVTRSVPFTAQVTLSGDILRASGEFSILQTAFGITLVSVAGGALKIKDEIKFAFDMVARKQE